MDVWAGDITFDENLPTLHDLRLYSKTITSLPVFSPQTYLHHLAFVNPSLIPLYLAAGPSLDVWTTNTETEAWFAQVLLGNHAEEEAKDEENIPWWKTHRTQSDIAVLIRVEGNGEDSDAQSGPRVTELLLYGIISKITTNSTLPTPPTSSSPGPGELVGIQEGERKQHAGKELRVYALPLSSDLLYRKPTPLTTQALEDVSAVDGDAKECSTPVSLVASTDEQFAQFLAPRFVETAVPSSSATKRKRVSTMLEDATERGKKARRRGGERVSRTMAHVEGNVSHALHGLKPLEGGSKNETYVTADRREVGRVTRHLDLDSQQAIKKPTAALSRSSSVSSARSVDEIQPSSRRGPITEGKRSSLHRVSSMVTTNDVAIPEARKTEARNKDALSRIIMAGMRIYGLQQRRKTHSQGLSQPPLVRDHQEMQRSIDGEEADEYKLVYHQVYKAACFAFVSDCALAFLIPALTKIQRRHIMTTLLTQDILRDIVDKVLALFCNDPIPLAPETTTELFGEVAIEKSPFSTVHVRHPVADIGGCDGGGNGNAEAGFSTPRVRRRFRDGEDSTAV
ncbi:MAG: hypothetical protein M1827_003590 [Pycnora praestabilis]|nr:MAG: hypothetical protein M1827_003590 [Pycnora praestabilis]